MLRPFLALAERHFKHMIGAMEWVKSIHSHLNKAPIMIYEIKPRRVIARRLLKRNAIKELNNLPHSITHQKTHSEFKMNSTISKSSPTEIFR